MAPIGILLGLGLLALMAGGASSPRSRGRRGVTQATRARVRETLATPDAAARVLPVEPAPPVVDPDLARPGVPSTAASAAAASSRSSQGARSPSSAATPAASRPTPSGPAEHEGTAPEEAAGDPNPDEARRLAAGTATAVRERRSGWRNRLRAFQRAAGIAVDGRYGGLSYNALIYYGIRNPPPTTSPPRPSAPSANYVDRVIAPPSGTGTGLEPSSSAASSPAAADMSFELDAWGRSPHEAGYGIDPAADARARTRLATDRDVETRGT